MNLDSVSYNEDFHKVGTSASDLTFSMSKLLTRLDNNELDAERKGLLKSIYSDFDRFEEFVARSSKFLIDSLEQQRDDLVPLARKAKAAYEKLQEQAFLFQQTALACTERMNQATQALYLERNFVLPSAYNTRADVAAHDKLIAECQEKQNEAVRAYNAQMEKQSEFEAKLAEASKVHNELLLKEQNIKSQIAKLQGKSVKHFDKTTGLETT